MVGWSRPKSSIYGAHKCMILLDAALKYVHVDDASFQTLN